MLFFAAAYLTTSASLNPVAEAFGAHEIAGYATVITSVESVPAGLSLTRIDVTGLGQAPTDQARAVVAREQATAVNADVATDGAQGVPPQPFVGPVPAAAAGSGTAFLGEIARIEPAQIGEFVRDNPGAIATLVTDPPRSQDVALWWNSLSPPARTELRGASPELVGNLDGIPFSTRDLANRTVLASTMRDLQATINSQPGRAAVEKAKLQLSMLQSIWNAMADASDHTSRTLMSLDVTGQGRAAIIVGDLATADYVSYMVPGMFFTIEGQMLYWTDAASRLRDEQQSWLRYYGDTSSTVATVAWIGYHTPNLTNVGSLDNAKEGRDSLAHSIEGLQTLRSGDEPYVTVIGHSYGSTAALMALTEYDFQIDALALVGSPGSSAQSVSQLHVKNGNVYVGKAQWDPVPNSAFFGSEPGSASYGATTFGTDGGTDPLTGDQLLRSFFHIEYFSPQTESLRNLALIGIGHGADVTLG